MDFRQFMKQQPVIFDGALGTMLQAAGSKAGELPETYNITSPELLIDIHQQYVAAGCDVISANTFGANELKLKHCSYSVEEVIEAAVRNARAANPRFVALDLGPTGQLIEPLGDLSFETVVDIYKRQIKAGVKAGVDVLLIETISDLHEAKAAIIAAKETTDLPIICSLSYQENARTFIGTDAVSATLALQGLGIDALGVNCSLGPESLLPIVHDILAYAQIPVIVQANAGLPRIEDGKAMYDITPTDYAACVAKMQAAGAHIFGGCCGTTPEYIQQLRAVIPANKPFAPVGAPVTACTSASKAVIFDTCPPAIGTNINPAGNADIAEALRSGDLTAIVDEVLDQADEYDILSINCTLPGTDEAKLLPEVISEVQSVTNCPLRIDSANIAAIEAAVRIYNGRPIIHNTSDSEDLVPQIQALSQKYGTLII